MQVSSFKTDKRQNHRDLLIYQRAYTASLKIYTASKNFPKEERYAITDQIRRASSSICANIAEGYGRQLSSDNDFKRFLVMAKGSCHEMSVWIDYCRDLGFINPETWENWHNEYQEISKMIYAFIQKL